MLEINDRFWHLRKHIHYWLALLGKLHPEHGIETSLPNYVIKAFWGQNHSFPNVWLSSVLRCMTQKCDLRWMTQQCALRWWLSSVLSDHDSAECSQEYHPLKLHFPHWNHPLNDKISAALRFIMVGMVDDISLLTVFSYSAAFQHVVVTQRD